MKSTVCILFFFNRNSALLLFILYCLEDMLFAFTCLVPTFSGDLQCFGDSRMVDTVPTKRFHCKPLTQYIVDFQTCHL